MGQILCALPGKPMFKPPQRSMIIEMRLYDLNIELNMNIRQFFLGMEESESIPITA